MTHRLVRASSLVALLAFLGSVIIAGCGSDEDPAANAGDDDAVGVAALEAEAPMRSLVWSPAEDAVVALRQDGRQLVKLETNVSFPDEEPPPAAITLPAKIDGVAGENLALEKGRTPENIYVPVPNRGEVMVLGYESLNETRTFSAGDSPTRAALLGGDRGTLFALSGDGSTVTAVDLFESYEVGARVELEEEAEFMEVSGEGEDRALWVAGPNFAALYGIPSLERLARMPINAGTLAVDDSDSDRAYVGESDRIVAVEPEGGSLKVVAEASLGGSVEYLAPEGDRVYAATPSELVVFDSGTLELLQTVGFDRSLEREPLKDAELSGLAVGERHVYIGLKGEPYIVLIEKP